VRKVISISISILYVLFGDGEEDYVYHGTTEFNGLHSHNKLVLKPRTLAALYDVCEPSRLLNIFPEYYLIEVERFTDRIRNPRDEWICFFKHAEIKSEFTAPGIQEAREKLDYVKLDDPKKQAYRRYREDLARERDVMFTARREAQAARPRGSSTGNGAESAQRKYCLRDGGEGHRFIDSGSHTVVALAA